jgi:hypothetical protein
MLYTCSLGAGLDTVLIGAPRDVDLRITRFSFDEVRARCDALGLRVGDLVRRIGTSTERTIVDVAGRGRTELSLGLSTCVHVEPSTVGVNAPTMRTHRRPSSHRTRSARRRPGRRLR